MSQAKSLQSTPQAAASPATVDPQTADLLALAAQLGPRDLAALTGIVRRAAEISERDGEATAIAVLDRIQGILRGREFDA
jgi:hypothetical protein